MARAPGSQRLSHCSTARRAASTGCLSSRKLHVGTACTDGYQMGSRVQHSPAAVTLGRRLRGTGRKASTSIATPSTASQSYSSSSRYLPSALSGQEPPCDKESQILESLRRVYSIDQKATALPPFQNTQVKERDKLMQLPLPSRPYSAPDGAQVQMRKQQRHSEPQLVVANCDLTPPVAGQVSTATRKNEGRPVSRAKLDSMGCPAILALRLNNQNFRGYLERKGSVSFSFLKASGTADGSARKNGRLGNQVEDALNDALDDISSLRFLRTIVSTSIKLSKDDQAVDPGEFVWTASHASAASNPLDFARMCEVELEVWFKAVSDMLSERTKNAAKFSEGLEDLQRQCSDALKIMACCSPKSLQLAGKNKNSAAPHRQVVERLVRGLQRIATRRLSQLEVDEEASSSSSESDQSTFSAEELNTQSQSRLPSVMSPLQHLAGVGGRKVTKDRYVASRGGSRRDSQASDSLEKRDALAATAFERFAEEGEIHEDALTQALTAIGFHGIKDEWIDAAFKNTTIHSTLDAAEFLRFVTAYDQEQLVSAQHAFQEADIDGNGTIDMEELAIVLKRCGITPLKFVLEEIAGEVAPGKDAINLTEFRRVLEIIGDREGFSRLQFEKFRTVFRRFDQDDSNTLCSAEFYGALSWLGYSTTRDNMDKIMQDVDSRGAGELTVREFMVCLRRVHELELVQVQEVLESLRDKTAHKREVLSEMEQVLRSLGFVPCRLAIGDVSEDTGLADSLSLNDVSLDGLWNFVNLYRTREGFCRKDSREISEAFERFDASQKGEINVFEVGKVLRWLGYPASWDCQRRLISKTDVDQSGTLNVQELRKLLRLYREDTLGKFKSIHNQLDSTGCGEVGIQEAVSALRRLGFIESTTEEISRWLHQGQRRTTGKRGSDENPTVALEPFQYVALTLQQKAKSCHQTNEGYGPLELKDMRKRFSDYDLDGNGTIEQKELQNLIQDLFPELATSANARPQLLKILTSAKCDSSATSDLDHRDFLRLMRQCHDMDERNKFQKELNAVEACGFDKKEVEDMRELFIGQFRDSGAASPVAEGSKRELSFEAFSELISGLVPMGEKNSQVAESVFEDFVSEENHAADFPEYLMIMWRLFEMNFAGINQRAKNMVETEAMDDEQVLRKEQIAETEAMADGYDATSVASESTSQ